MRRTRLLAALFVGLCSVGTAPARADAPAPPERLALSKGGVGEAAPRFIEMFVAGVVPSPDGHTLVLINAEEEVLLPLGIGLPEALSIHGRLEHLTPSRPMTHDLLESVVEKLGGQVVRAQIDDLKDDIFIGSIIIETGGKTISVDARPSDAIALALASHAPIFVARPVVDRAALHPGDLEKAAGDDAGPAPPPPLDSKRAVLSL